MGKHRQHRNIRELGGVGVDQGRFHDTLSTVFSYLNGVLFGYEQQCS